MRCQTTASSCLSVLAFALVACRQSLPEAYGIYANTNRGRLPLQGESVAIAGNILNPIPGLQGPSGTECSSLRDFIVYQKDVEPEHVGLARLEFFPETQITAFLAPTRVRVNLWLPKETLQVDVKPVEARRDMYFIAPRKPLDKGFYALYIGSFGGAFGTENRVYDLVVGSIKDFPSYQARLEQLRNDAGRVIGHMNQLLNEAAYSQLGDVYRPGGSILSGEDLQTFISGNKTWLGSSGKILRSDVTGVSLSDDGRNVQCAVKTTYEKIGPRQEAMTLEKIGEQYFVTQIR
jgi:hypothetical protein